MHKRQDTSCKDGQLRQAVLGVARRCRDCGTCLGPFEGALHQCTAALAWPFQAECVGRPGAGVSAPSSGIRIVRIGARPLTTTACAQFEALWEFVRRDLSHSLDPPTCEALASGACTVLLGLRAREVVGLVWVEWAAEAELLLEGRNPGGASLPDEVQVEGLPAESTQAGGAALGVVLLWTRRAERRRGLATALVDAARQHAAGVVAAPLPLAKVAFSQPTDSGFAFARRYCQGVHGGRVLIYHPSSV